MSLAAIVITHNEAVNIARCLKSLDFCDEVIVVDSGSLDETRDIASQYASSVYVRSWQGYVRQKNDTIRLTDCEWVLSVDADEVVSAELRDEILEVLSKNPDKTAFRLPRKTYHSGKWIRHGGWYPNYLARLFKKNQGRWVGGDLHEYWETDGEEGVLNSALYHYSFKSIFDQVERNNRYSTLGAKALDKKGINFSIFKLLVKPLSKFVETYFLKRGFLDGFPGFIISVSAGYSVFLKWAKLWELERLEKAKKEKK